VTADSPITPLNPAGSTAASAAERYAAGQMSDSEELAFETRMLEDPQLAAEVDTVHRIRQGFRELDSRGEIAPGQEWSRFWKAPYAIAATVTLLVLGAAGVLMLRTPAVTFATPALLSSLSGADAARVVAEITFASTRGAQASGEAPSLPRSQLVSLKILPAVSSDAYRVTLEPAGDAATMAAVTVNATSDTHGFVIVYVDSSRLEPGTYRLLLAGSADTETFEFRVPSGN